MGISIKDLDDLTIGFLIDLLQQYYSDNKQDEVIEATPEILERF